MQQRRRGHACAVLPVWCAGHIIVKSVGQVPTLTWWSMQPRHVCRPTTLSKAKILFHRDPSCFENKRSAQQDWKWGKKWLDIFDVDVHSNAPASQVRQRPSLVCSSLQVFLRCNSIFPGVILALLLHGLFSSIASLTCFWRPQQGSRIDIGERGDWPVSVGEDRQTDSVALETAEHLQPLLNDLLAVSLVTGKRKMWRKLRLGEHEKGLRGRRLLAWQGSRWRRAQTRRHWMIAERKDRDLMFFDRRFVGPKQTSGLQSAS